MLSELRSILIVISESAPGEAAMHKGIQLARASGARLTLLDVAAAVPAEAERTLPPRALERLVATSRENQTERLEALQARAEQAGIAVRTKAANGHTWRVAIQEVLAEGHDLVLRTCDDGDGGARAGFGSTNRNLLRKCPCPLWLVRPDDAQGRRHVLAAVDAEPFDEERHELSVRILRTAADIAALDAAALDVLHAWHVFGEILLREPKSLVSDPEIDHIVGQTLNRHARMLDELVEAAELSGITPGTHLVHQKAAPAIVDFAESHDVDLLVLGTVGRSGIPGFIIGNTAEQVLDEVTCSVLALKPAGFVSPVTPEN